MDTNSIKEYLEEETGEPLHFLEYRVALVKTDMTGVNYQTCSDEDFYEEAAEQGTIFSLKGFELFIYSGAMTEMMNSVQHPYYLLPRFIPIFEDQEFRTYVDTRENRRNRYEL
jgi:hypothetical protein